MTKDPEIKDLQQEHKQKVKDLKRRRESAALLKTILEKRLPKLVMSDREKLMDALALNTTPSIPCMLQNPVRVQDGVVVGPVCDATQASTT